VHKLADRAPGPTSDGYELPALARLVVEYRPTGRRARLTVITHLLPTAISYIRFLARHFDVDVIAIPYSATKGIETAVSQLGCTVAVPVDLTGVTEAALRSVERANLDGQPVVVQEIGGYLAGSADRLEKYQLLRGIVEDTKNGFWRYEAAAAQLSYPVVSISHSPIKAMEDRRVGAAVAFSIERLLRETFHSVLDDVTVLVMGYGSIGSACAFALRSRGAMVLVHDTNAIREMQAGLDGFRTGSAHELASNADVIVGATGSLSVDMSIVAAAPPGVLLASASSRQVELDMPAIQRGSRIVTALPSLTTYRRGGRDIHVAADGYPINFQQDSILGGVLDAVYSELFACIREVAEGRLKPGLRQSPGYLHAEVANAWTATHAAAKQAEFRGASERSMRLNPGRGPSGSRNGGRRAAVVATTR
jgi:adenosylhomocysteinase